MNQPLIENQQNSPDTHFERMARRIVDNLSHPFGGAVVIVPPGGVSPIEMLMLDPNSDIAMFWSTIRTKIDILLASAEAEKRRQAGFGGR